jgi:hypothetical protein
MDSPMHCYGLVVAQFITSLTQIMVHLKIRQFSVCSSHLLASS